MGIITLRRYVFCCNATNCDEELFLDGPDKKDAILIARSVGWAYTTKRETYCPMCAADREERRIEAQRGRVPRCTPKPMHVKRPDLVAIAKDRISSGEKYGEVADSMGICRTTLTKWRKLGLIPEPLDGGRGGPAPYSKSRPDLVERATKLVNDGVSLAEISKRLSVSKFTLSRWRREGHIPPRVDHKSHEEWQRGILEDIEEK